MFAYDVCFSLKEQGLWFQAELAGKQGAPWFPGGCRERSPDLHPPCGRGPHLQARAPARLTCTEVFRVQHRGRAQAEHALDLPAAAEPGPLLYPARGPALGAGAFSEGKDALARGGTLMRLTLLSQANQTEKGSQPGCWASSWGLPVALPRPSHKSIKTWLMLSLVLHILT